MIAAFPVTRPDGAALGQRIGKAMDVILHIGAHRCGTTTFQHYMHSNADSLAQAGIGFWGPERTRKGLFRGLSPETGATAGRDLRQRAIGRVQMHLSQTAALGHQKLVVSDENMLGTVRQNLRSDDLYHSAGERVARYFQAFEGHVSDVILNIRSLENYWTSALAFGLTRGRSVPGPEDIARLAQAPRSWRDVITDVACATSGARLWVLPFEVFSGRPEAQLQAVTKVQAPQTHARSWRNARLDLTELRKITAQTGAERLPEGDGPWQPFDAAQKAALHNRYVDDMNWIKAGADGVARLMMDPDKT